MQAGHPIGIGRNDEGNRSGAVGTFDLQAEISNLAAIGS